MRKIYTAVCLLGYLAVSSQEIQWQKNIQSSTQEFLTTMTSTIDRQILLSGSSINQKSQQLIAKFSLRAKHEQ
ncbi:hypothetical protein [Epilithonimonas hispanica]|uniref:Uncharacterized protein n=1 Tax=Epilithonimonas hispanica TaxID=358687 RepID=A0A3D9CKG6_9FLAO|nr:hypothetical protein [Epilithonimonas hispanica]REC66225.1 hypothetical protein DRF58_16975 [Epilithonimonas hispanica]